jgi:hypothetical protein
LFIPTGDISRKPQNRIVPSNFKAGALHRIPFQLRTNSLAPNTQPKKEEEEEEKLSFHSEIRIEASKHACSPSVGSVLVATR